MRSELNPCSVWTSTNKPSATIIIGKIRTRSRNPHHLQASDKLPVCFNITKIMNGVPEMLLTETSDMTIKKVSMKVECEWILAAALHL